MTITGTPLVPSSSVYSASDIVALMTAEHQWMSQTVTKEPMIGLVNGSNKVFEVGIKPAASLTVTDYLGNSVAVTSFDGESGFAVLTAAPVNTVFATYTSSIVKPSAIDGIAAGAVSLMESLWARGYGLVDSGGTLYLSSDDDTVVDATIYPSRVQSRFLADCVFYTWVRSYYLEATMHGISYREQRASGLQVDRSRQPASFDTLLKLASDNLRASLSAAMYDAGAETFAIADAGIVLGRSTSVQPFSGWYDDPIFPYP